MKPKQFFYILSAATGIVLLITGFVYLKTALGFRAQNIKLGQTLADIQVAENKSDQLAILGNDYETRVKPRLGLINQILPAEKKQEEIIAQISDLAEQTGVAISGLSFPPASAEAAPSGVAGTAPVQVTFTAAGSYAESYAFLQGLENSTRVNDILEVGFTKSAELISTSYKVNFFTLP